MACKGCNKNKTSSKPARSAGAKTYTPKPKSSEKTFVFKDGKKYEIRT